MTTSIMSNLATAPTLTHHSPNSSSSLSPTNEGFSGTLKKIRDRSDEPTAKVETKKSDAPTQKKTKSGEPGNKDPNKDKAASLSKSVKAPGSKPVRDDDNDPSSNASKHFTDQSHSGGKDENLPLRSEGSATQMTTEVKAPKIAKGKIAKPNLEASGPPKDPSPANGNQGKSSTDATHAGTAHSSSQAAQAAAVTANNGNAASAPPNSGASGDQNGTGTTPTGDAQGVGLKLKAFAPTGNQAPADSATKQVGDASNLAAPPSPTDATPKDQTITGFRTAIGVASQAIDPAAGNGTSHIAQAQFTPAPPPQTPSPDVQFAQDNHGRIATSIHGQLLPNGGTMQIRLDPPELGPIQLTVKMENGMLSASFQTTNDQATRLLSHTLSQLKTALETQGVSVDRLHVEQAAKPQNSSSSGGSHEDSNPNSALDQRTTQQEQQRKEMVRKMWARISGGADPLDLVA